jgi:hypothetical protein
LHPVAGGTTIVEMLDAPPPGFQWCRSRSGRWFLRRRSPSAVERGEHGTVARSGCGCRRCVVERRRRERVAYHETAALHGRSSSWHTSSNAAAAHVRVLVAAGADVELLAKRAELHPETVRRVLRGARVLSSTSRALLAL